MTVIIFEGLDRCGKSTQIKRLMKHFTDKPIQWLHYSSIKGLSAEEQTAWFQKEFRHMFSLIQDNSAHWFLDRSHLGERVYGTLYRPNVDTSYVFDLEQEFKVNQMDMYLFVFYDSSLGNLKRDDGDSYSTDEDIVRKEIDLFKKAAVDSSIKNKMLIDIAGKNPDEVEMQIFDYLSFENK